MNDKLCLEHGLSIVENPKPSREHYGTWLGNKKQPSFQEQIRIAIDAALEEKPKRFLRNFYRSWKLLGWKSTVKENIFGSEFRDKKIIPDAIRSKAIIQNRPSKNGLPVHGQ